jgi:hypothetical protein
LESRCRSRQQLKPSRLENQSTENLSTRPSIDAYEYHDIVLLILFAVQVLALTPATDVISKKLCWRRFDRTMNAIRSLVPEVRLVEHGITEVDKKIASIFGERDASRI